MDTEKIAPGSLEAGNPRPHGDSAAKQHVHGSNDFFRFQRVAGQRPAPSAGFGLLLLHVNSTTLVAGDAVATTEHMEQGKVLKGGYDLSQARDSFVEAVEIADVIIPGHDNLLLNPSRRPM